MASKISGIKTQLLTEIETTSIVEAYDGIVEKSTQYPYAEMSFDDMEYPVERMDMSNYLDVFRSFTLMIIGKTVEQVQQGIEDLQKLFMPLSSDLADLDVILIVPISASEPLPTTDKADLYFGAIKFQIQIRYDYNA